MSLFAHGFTKEKEGDGSKEREVQKKGKKRGREESKKAYEKDKRDRHFVDSWRDAFKWVDFDSEEGVMFCVACRKFDSKSEGRYVKGTDHFKKDSLESHEASKPHLTCMKKYEMKLLKEKNISVHTSYRRLLNM